jgi:hypothetical protein
MAEGFLGRWSQRKQDVRSGKTLVEPEVQAVSATTPDSANSPILAELAAKVPTDPTAKHIESSAIEKAEVPLPTLEDVKNLTPQSNYAPFVAHNVSPEVRNTAMKKLFTDPHYNIMDRLDIYIDDYTKPDPIPESMLRQMVSARFLNLFDDEEKPEESVIPSAPATAEINTSLGSDVHSAGVQSVAQSGTDTSSLPSHPTPHSPPPPGMNDDHSDLRLQQNHAAGPQKPGRSAE